METEELNNLYMKAFNEFSNENEIYYNSLVTYQSIVKQILSLPLKYDENISKTDMFVSINDIQKIIKHEMNLLNEKNKESLNKIKTNN
jgi:hypothetical protein